MRDKCIRMLNLLHLEPYPNEKGLIVWTWVNSKAYLRLSRFWAEFVFKIHNFYFIKGDSLSQAATLIHVPPNKW